MLLQRLSKVSLLTTLRHNIIIYMRDHNKLITPENTKLKLSYLHPKNIIPDMPQQKKIEFKLKPQLQQQMQREIFEQYKKKILTGTIDQVPEKVVDQIWGEQEPPIHYYGRIGKHELNAVSFPQKYAFQSTLQAIYQPYFASAYVKEISKETIQKANIHELVEISVAARQQNIEDGAIWFEIESGLDRGMKLHLLKPQQLISLKYAFDGKKKFGTPKFHQILSDILREDIPRINKDSLIHLFYACRFSNSGQTNLQLDVLKGLQSYYSKFTFEEKANFLLLFTMGGKALRYYRQVHNRRRNQFRQLARSVVFRLNFWDLQLNNENVSKIIYALAKLRLSDTKFITLPIVDHIKQNLDSFSQDPNRLMIANVFLPELQNCQGVADQNFLTLLKQKSIQNWESYQSIDKLRMIHSWWNMGLMDQALLDLYKGVQLTADTSTLYYACQLEMAVSSERQWQVIQLMAQIPYVPIPYFSAYKRFYNYIKNTTEWNLDPLKDKLVNTEYFFNVYQKIDGLLDVKIYREFRQFQKFVDLKLAESDCPIENIEIAHFAYPTHQISLDIVTSREYITGTKKLKETYMNKVRSLQNLGWKHLAFDQSQLSTLRLADILKNIQDSYLPYVEEQKAVIEYLDHKQSEYIQRIKAIQTLNQFDVKFQNFVLYGKRDTLTQRQQKLLQGNAQGYQPKKQVPAQ